MRLYLGFLFIILFSSVMRGECRPNRMDSCVKMNLHHKEYGILESILFLKPMCNVEFEEVESKKKWKALVRGCPDMGGSKYVYIMYSCAEPPFSILEHDELEIWEKGGCEAKYADRSQARAVFAEINEVFKKDNSVNNILKSGFFIREKDGSIWKFHLHPGYAVEAEVYNNSCGDGSICDENSYKILRLIEKRREFVRF